jgi:hypothetical protein
VKKQIEKLQKLCKLYGYELVYDVSPHTRSDALGTAGLQCEAQLCENRKIAVGPHIYVNTMAYQVSHELAHGIVGFCDEKAVLLEQASILARWVDLLTKEEGKKDG